jgi:hypothetical protein
LFSSKKTETARDEARVDVNDAFRGSQQNDEGSEQWQVFSLGRAIDSTVESTAAWADSVRWSAPRIRSAAWALTPLGAGGCPWREAGLALVFPDLAKPRRGGLVRMKCEDTSFLAKMRRKACC